MALPAPTSDAELLRRCDADAEVFAVFYRRHLPVVLGFVVRRIGDRELAADLTAEVFAKALVSRHTYDPERGSARSWLCTIAASKIIDAVRRGRVEDEARRRLQADPVVFYDSDLERVDLIAASDAEIASLDEMLDELGPKTRHAIEQHVLEDRDYSEIARELRCSESVIRKRVSRGLARLREQLTEAR